MKALGLVLGLLITLAGQAWGQLEGDWYSIRTVGFSRITISDDYLISVGKMDSLSYSVSDYERDSLQLVKGYYVGDTVHVLAKNVRNDYLFDKFVFDPTCNCLLTTFVDFGLDTVPTPETFERVVANDESKEHLTTYYRLATMQSFHELKALKSATAAEFVAILQTMLENYTRLAELIERQDLVISPFGPMALVRGNLESEALIQHGFSPFYSKAEHHMILEKYKDNPDVQEVIDALEKR